MHTLDVWRLNRELPNWDRGFPHPLVDLSRIEAIDPYTVVFLLLYARLCAEAGGRLRLLLPRREEVARVLAQAGLFRWAGEAIWTDRPPPEGRADGSFGIVRVEDEGEIQGLVDRACDVLAERFPLGQHSIELLAGAMLELLQNIPHHANPLGEEIEPYGLAAVQEFSDHIHLVVMDKGVGLHRSLALNPRYRGLDERRALEAVLLQGASRFTDPGRGGALRRIREIVQANEGRMLVRSGGAGFWQAEVEWGVEEVHPFPGVQISVQLPKALFFG